MIFKNFLDEDYDTHRVNRHRRVYESEEVNDLIAKATNSQVKKFLVDNNCNINVCFFDSKECDELIFNFLKETNTTLYDFINNNPNFGSDDIVIFRDGKLWELLQYDDKSIKSAWKYAAYSIVEEFEKRGKKLIISSLQ